MSGEGRITKLGNISNQDLPIWVNVFGVVKFIRKPTPTRGSDKSLFLTLVDPTLYENETSLKCLIFERHDEKFPIIHNIGDVVKFTSLKIAVYNQKPQGLGRSKAGFSWITFDGRRNVPVVPRFSPISLPSFDETDKKTVEELKLWAASVSFLSSTESRRSVDQITGDDLYFDLLCQVVHVTDWVSTNTSSFLAVHVWDGTCPVVAGIASENNDSFVTATKWGYKVLGKCVKIYVFRNDCDPVVSVSPGDYVIINNLHLTSKEEPVPDKAVAEKAVGEKAAGEKAVGEVVAQEFIAKRQKIPLLELHGGRTFGRGITVLSEDDPDVKRLVARIEAVPLPPVPDSANPTPNGQSNQKPSTSGVEVLENRTEVQNVAGNPRPAVGGMMPPRCMGGVSSIRTVKLSGSVPRIFICRPVLHMFLPKTPLEFLRYLCRPCRKMFDLDEISGGFDARIARSCQNADCNKPLVMSLFFTLILRDATGMIDVSVFDDEAKDFLRDIDPVSLATDERVQQSVHDGMKDLLMGKVKLEYVIESFYSRKNEVGRRPIAYRLKKTRVL